MRKHAMVLFGLMVMGCTGVETTPVEDQEELELSVGKELAAKGLGEDPYAIGGRWYNYDSSTHALTPKDLVWAIKQDQQMIGMVEIISYYDDKGESGYFTLDLSTWDGNAWSTTTQLTLKDNVKEHASCIDLRAKKITECEDTNAHLIARTISRVVPEAGFAVSNPALFTRSHPMDAPEQRLEVIELEAKTLEQAKALLNEDQGRVVESVEHDLGTSRVGWIHQHSGDAPFQDIHMQVTTNLTLIQWQLQEVKTKAQQTTITLNVLCQRANVQDQAPFEDQAQGHTFSWTSSTSYSVALVRLCDPTTHTPDVAVNEQQNVPYRQDWPASSTFDWIVEQVDGRVSIRPGPGHLLWNWSMGSGDTDTQWRAVDVRNIWERSL